MHKNKCTLSKICTGILSLSVLGSLVPLTLPGESPVSAQQLAKQEFPAGIQYVPPDAALFVYADAEKIWENSIIQSVRKSDPKFFDQLVSMAQTELGFTPDDVKSIVAFIPTLKDPGDTQRFGVALTFRKAYDRDKITKGVKKLIDKKTNLQVVAVNDRLALILVGLGDSFAKPQPIDMEGPLTAALKEAATGKHTAVLGSNLANLTDEIRRDDLPGQIRPFQPLLRSETVTATLDLGKTIDLDVRLKAATVGQAVDCEKAIGVLLRVIQDGLADSIKELEPVAMKNMIVNDLLAVMKAGSKAAKNAKFSTDGNELRLTASLPTDLPFSSAYLAAKQNVFESADGRRSANNLKQIALAMHNYHDVYGNFPPAVVCDKKGNPLLSWRVLILPFIEQQSLYNEFKLDEPWDSEHNKKLLAKMPKVYAIPGKNNDGDTDTYYRVFVGNGAGFDLITGTKITSIRDGTSNTIMCVTASNAVPWTKPEELEFDPEKDMTKLLGGFVKGNVQAAFFDGSVRTFGKIPDKMTLNALITRDGGEVIPEIP